MRSWYQRAQYVNTIAAGNPRFYLHGDSAHTWGNTRSRKPSRSQVRANKNMVRQADALMARSNDLLAQIRAL